ncbi:MAG: histidine kinase, partial [Methylobacter sp.]|nr:histidine kinase [Methylobacter sp.]
MFWNIFKKKTPKQSSGNDKSDFPVAHAKEPTAVKSINIPVSFLKRLLPVAQLLTEKEIQNL